MSANVRDIDHGWKNIKKEFLSLKQPYVKVGVLSDSSYEDGQNVASIAAYNEFGTSSIPPRPFMAQTFDQNISKTRNFIAQEYGKVLDRKQSISNGLYKIGTFYQTKIRQQISTGDFVENKSSTLRRKNRTSFDNKKYFSKESQKLHKSSRPLIDTGRLRQSINFEVVLK